MDWNIYYADDFKKDILVTPCVGVWIETKILNAYKRKQNVTPCVGVWIETFRHIFHAAYILSHPAWVCGLKHPFRELLNGCNSHTLRGCVDWNPFKTTSPIAISCHTLRGCVDWNNREIAIRCDRRRVTPCVGVWIETNVQAAPVGPLIVTPCVGVWIETSNSVQTGWPISSHPAWVYMDWSIVHSLVKFMEEL